MAIATPWQQVEARFKDVWGYDSFRPPQDDVIRTLLDKKDALIVMPTGGGKSICFQLPALLQRGVTLVISPLVALMEDQVQELKQRHLAAERLHSALTPFEKRQTLQKLQQNWIRLLYLSPETLLSRRVWETLCLPDVQINGLILDEAHCLVQWGDTFRPSYRRLGAVRSTLLSHKPRGTKLPIAAFTATANPAAQQTICNVLRLQQPKEIKLSPYRPNLNLAVKVVWTPRGRRRTMRQFIQAHPGQAGLVYVRTRKTAEELAQWLKPQGFSVEAYHAGLTSGNRRRIEADWIAGDCQFVVCTSAFGMGINHPRVRWVCHFHAPSTLSEYVQEIGRGGRDGKPADALTLVSEPTGWLDSADKKRWQFFSESERKLKQEAQQLIKSLSATGHIDQVLQQNGKAATALALLHSQQKLIWEDPFHYRLTEGTTSKPGKIYNSIQEIKDYLFSRKCRWQTLLVQFGCTAEANGMQCGHCDTCKK
ncbi:RecQ family ATP-dependent DNA helicase [Leptothoe kymatousa]|uniref:DNA 3'-5' helicase n=1 Tax=Leptothoe kymatousa TAU-MAC 1615 TaxID=2364775 RepID=A0ABS5Y2U4_9CYAN|nr:ATP-dependent DNA helicase RecQ [Leptothoe kymatousa]MBT9312135.1 ATP-dependent DNA helicase RecQ [Leptothoe kymatousa TAU-MAC 1615]